MKLKTIRKTIKHIYNKDNFMVDSKLNYIDFDKERLYYIEIVNDIIYQLRLMYEPLDIEINFDANNINNVTLQINDVIVIEDSMLEAFLAAYKKLMIK